MTFFNLRSMHYPCCECKGYRKLLLHTVCLHLIKNGRDPYFRVWRRPGVRDLSHEEWENSGTSLNQRPHVPLDSHVNKRDMVDNAFLEEPRPQEVDDIAEEVVADAFTLGDFVHAECSGTSYDDEGPNVPTDDGTSDGDPEHPDDNSGLDPAFLEEAMKELYDGSHTTKLAATILVMNLCTVHGVSNNFTDELFTILHCHLMPIGNNFPRNHYATKTLTAKLGLSYNTIHACENGCVLFKGEYADVEVCPKCGGPRFSNVEQKKFPVKVLRHFPITPQL